MCSRFHAFSTPIASLISVICIALASSLQSIGAAAPVRGIGRHFVRSVNVDNAGTTDTLEWYCDESILYDLTPRTHFGGAVTIPTNATASWIVLDPASSNTYICASASTVTPTSVSFFLPAGSAALPRDITFESYVLLLDGTNLLGVADHAYARCLWSPLAPAAEVTPTNALLPLIQAVIDAFGDHYASTNYVTARLDSLWVVNAGGYHYPDYFTASARVGGEPVDTIAISTNTTLNAIEMLHETASVRGWILEPEIERQSEFGEGVEWSFGPEADGLWRLAGNMVVPDGATAETVATGEVYRVTGRLGDFERTVELKVSGDNVLTRGAWQFDSWKVGSLAGSAADVESLADARSSWSSHVRTWPEGYGSGTNHVVAGWNENAWIQSHVFSACSYHTDTAPGVAGGSYRPVTLVTPRHGVVASHFKPLLGSNVYWVGISGTIHTNRVVAYDNIRGDLSVARLADPVDESDFEFPYLLPYDYEGFFYGCEHGGVGCKGVPVVSFNNYEMAWLTYWQCAPAMTAKHAWNSKAYTVKARGSGTAHGRADAAIGGDSGSPTFLRVTDAGDEPKWVLLGCFLWGGGNTAGGPIPLIDDVNTAISTWGDEERAAVADFESWGFEKYNPGLAPW